MALSSEILSQFAKVTVYAKNAQDAKTETTHYGTIVEYDGSNCVKLDGSDQLTPIASTVTVKPGERVMVLVKNHSATVTGNVTNPSVGKEEYIEVKTEVQDTAKKITELEIVVAHRVTTEELEAINATITSLKAKAATFDDIDAINADITNLEAKFADVEYLTATDIDAINADIEVIRGKFADITDITTEQLDAVNADIDNLRGYTADFTYLSTDVLTAIKADIKQLEVDKLSAKDVDLKYANIDFTNIGEAAIKNFYATSGIIKDLVISEGTITGELVGVTIKGDLIEGGTVKADKLVVKGKDGIYYKLNYEGGSFKEGEAIPDDGLHGSVIVAKSVTAEKVAVDDLVAFDATIGGFHITENSIYSGVKESVDNTTSGVYLDEDGQVNFGDGNNYMRYFKDQNGNWKLEISAANVLIGSGNINVEDLIVDLEEDIKDINISGRNLIRQSETLDYEDYSFSNEPTLTYEVVTSVEEMTSTDSNLRYVMFDEEFGAYFLWTYYAGSWDQSYTEWNGTDDGRYNIVEAMNPYSAVDKVISFTTESASDTFVFSSITTPGTEYTFSCWCLARNSIFLNGTELPVNVDTWTKLSLTFTAESTDMVLTFDSVVNENYYIYHPKLETGNKATDWTKAPEDFDDALNETNEDLNEALDDNAEKISVVETLIAKLEDAIAMLVTDGDGGSLMTQTENGWTFSMAETNDAMFALSEALNSMTSDLGDTNAIVERLDSAVTDLGELASYVKIDKSGEQPLIELGTSDGEFRLLITNTDIRFTQGSSVPAYISNKALHITKAVIEEEMELGGFVIKKRSNGNLGFLWKGVTE